MTPKSLAAIIRKLDDICPISASYARALKKAGIWSDEAVWYTSQKEHWLGWLSEYDGPGAYSRKIHRGRTAEFVYNHIVCPPMLLWLWEASGVSKTIIRNARTAAMQSRSTLASHCASIRKVVPWEEIDGAFSRGKKPSPH
jgi:hypothetical protein